MKYGLSKISYEKIKEIIQKYPEYQFKVFGSRARGNYKEASDIDIVVYGELKNQNKIKILNDFDLLDIPYMVDIVFYQDLLKEEFKIAIDREGILYE